MLGCGAPFYCQGACDKLVTRRRWTIEELFNPWVICVRKKLKDAESLTKGIVDESFVPKGKKPRPAPTSAPKPAPKSKHVQLFKMRHKVGNWF